MVADFRARVSALGLAPKPVSQSLYIDLSADATEPPSPIHLGFRSGSAYLLGYLKALEELGMNHLVFNLRFNQDPIETTMKRLSDSVLAKFI